MALKKSQLYSSLWASCDELRGGMDALQYKDYVLVLLFVKYVSDRYAGQPYAVITIPPGASLPTWWPSGVSPTIGDQINKKIRGPLAHAKRLADMPDFNDPAKLGSGEGESRAPHEPGRHLRERCPRFLEEPRRGRRLREDAEAIAARRSGSPQPTRAR